MVVRQDQLHLGSSTRIKCILALAPGLKANSRPGLKARQAVVCVYTLPLAIIVYVSIALGIGPQVMDIGSGKN